MRFPDSSQTIGKSVYLFEISMYFILEICLLTNARRVASVRAETYCNLYALDRTSFHEVLLNYPFMRRTLESVAAERLHQLGRDPMTVIHRKNIQEDLEIVKEIVSLVSCATLGRSAPFLKSGVLFARLLPSSSTTNRILQSRSSEIIMFHFPREHLSFVCIGFELGIVSGLVANFGE